MLFSDSYKIICKPEKILYKSKGSRFIAYAFPVKSEFEIKIHLKNLENEYPDATHRCFAWILGNDKQNFRTNDDGEPSNTAGKPILRQIHKFDLTNTLVVVVRYFGGTMLGVPGLIKAYGESAFECLKACKIDEFKIIEIYILTCPFGSENEVFRICKQTHAVFKVLQEAACFSAEIKIPLQQVAAFKRQIEQLYQIVIKYKGVE